jgi:hypothetical protein
MPLSARKSTVTLPNATVLTATCQRSLRPDNADSSVTIRGSPSDSGSISTDRTRAGPLLRCDFARASREFVIARPPSPVPRHEKRPKGSSLKKAEYRAPTFSEKRPSGPNFSPEDARSTRSTRQRSPVREPSRAAECRARPSPSLRSRPARPDCPSGTTWRFHAPDRCAGRCSCTRRLTSR